MTIMELRNKLEEEGVPENMYSLLIGRFPNEAFCLIEIDNGWEVYYSERGKKKFHIIYIEGKQTLGKEAD